MCTIGAATACGGGAAVVFVGVGAAAGVGEIEMGVAAAVVIEPSSSETSFGGAVLPEKNSAAESAGSAEGAGG